MAIDRAALKANLETALTRVTRELAEGDIKPNYSINGQSVNWPEYRRNLLDEAERLNQLIDEIGEDDGGIVIEETQMWT